MRPDVGEPDDPRRSRALIGDGRNDENLIVSQLHLAFIRFHNAVVERILRDPRAPSDPEEVFRRSREQVVWTYQWLIVNEYLLAITPSRVLRGVIEDGAPVYGEMLKRFRRTGLRNVMPLPLEFSVAAFRFGHSMVRGSYDFNLNFGRPAVDLDGPERASFELLFAFTGTGGGSGLAAPFAGLTEVLPHNWIIEWDRFVANRPPFRDRLARAIDTHLAPDLFDMTKADPGVFRNLALRNLRRGYNMNLPTGQSSLAALRDLGRPLPRPMTRDDLIRGSVGRAILEAGLDEHTPLWLYLLKEAEETQRGARLGAVGGTIVAETLYGVILNDPASYLHRSGSGAGDVWHPRDGVQPMGRPVTSLARLLQAAGVL